MNILILGANGFIGSHLVEAILQETDWHVDAMDLTQHQLMGYLDHPRFHFKQGDITQEKKWIDAHIERADVVVPLAAIATPALYVKDPLRVFALDFEANLAIIKSCVAFKKHLLFPSTSEVYGMCEDSAFDEETSNLVTGPINKPRWIYSSCKQLLDRIIYAYGMQEGLSYTLFRPFNWYGPRLDDVFNPKPGASRAVSQFIGNILRGQNIQLVDGGTQQRCMTYVSDGIAAIIAMIRHKNDTAHQQIFNVGNPYENVSIHELATTLIRLIDTDYPNYRKHAQSVSVESVAAKDYYGNGYQDVRLRVPAIDKAKTLLAWEPCTTLSTGLKATLQYYLHKSTNQTRISS